MTKSLNGVDAGPVDRKIQSLFCGFTADAAFHGDLNLIRSLSDVFTHEIVKKIFSGIDLFEELSGQIKRVQIEVPEASLLPINPSAENRNPISDVVKDPIAASLLEPIPDDLKGDKAAIMTLRCVIILGMMYTNKNPEKKPVDNLKDCAREIRLAVSWKHFESRKDALVGFTKSLESIYGISQLLSAFSYICGNTKEDAGKKLFREINELASSLDYSFKQYSGVERKLSFSDGIEDSAENAYIVTVVDEVAHDELDRDLEVDIDEPDDETSIFADDDDELDEYIQGCSNSEEATGEILSELTLFVDANSKEREKLKSHWQYNNLAHLAYSTTLFNEIERTWLSDELEMSLEDKWLMKPATIISIAICTSNSIENTLKMIMGEKGDISKNKIYKKKIYAPEGAVLPKEDEAMLYHGHVDSLSLELPSIAVKLLEISSLNDTEGVILSDAIEYNYKNNDVTVEDFVARLRERYSSRFVLPRVKNQLKHFVLSNDKDPTLAYMLFGTPEYSPPIPNFYRWMMPQHVEMKYKKYSALFFKGRV